MAKKQAPSTKDTIRRAVELAGGAPKISEVTNWPRTTIYSMCERGSCSPARAIQLEKLSGISRVALCPDFPWGVA